MSIHLLRTPVWHLVVDASRDYPQVGPSEQSHSRANFCFLCVALHQISALAAVYGLCNPAAKIQAAQIPSSACRLLESIGYGTAGDDNLLVVQVVRCLGASLFRREMQSILQSQFHLKFQVMGYTWGGSFKARNTVATVLEGYIGLFFTAGDSFIQRRSLGLEPTADC